MLLTGGTGGVFAAERTATATSAPIMVLVQPEAGTDKEEATAPVFLLYSDGRVFVGQRKEGQLSYVQGRLSEDELSRFNGRLIEVVRDPDFDDRLVYASGRPSSSETFLFVGGASGVGVATHVSGFCPLSDRSEARLLNPTTKNFPFSLQRLYRLVVELELTGAVPWVPEPGAAGAKGRVAFPGEAAWRGRIDDLMKREEAARAPQSPDRLTTTTDAEAAAARKKSLKDLAPPPDLKIGESMPLRPDTKPDVTEIKPAPAEIQMLRIRTAQPKD